MVPRAVLIDEVGSMNFEQAAEFRHHILLDSKSEMMQILYLVTVISLDRLLYFLYTCSALLCLLYTFQISNILYIIIDTKYNQSIDVLSTVFLWHACMLHLMPLAAK